MKLLNSVTVLKKTCHHKTFRKEVQKLINNSEGIYHAICLFKKANYSYYPVAGKKVIILEINQIEGSKTELEEIIKKLIKFTNTGTYSYTVFTKMDYVRLGDDDN